MTNIKTKSSFAWIKIWLRDQNIKIKNQNINLLLIFTIHFSIFTSLFTSLRLNNLSLYFVVNLDFARTILRMYIVRISPPEVFLGKGILKICSKVTGQDPCQSVISIKMFCNFIEITLWHGCFLVTLLQIFPILFPRNAGGLLLYCD